MADRYASLKQGLVGCWIPSVSGSGLLLPDLSGRGNNGVLTNMDASDWVSSQYGKALDFDGSNDEVIANQSTPVVIAKSCSIAAWVNLPVVTGLTNRTIANFGSNTTGFYSLQFSGSPGRFGFQGWDLTNNAEVTATAFSVIADQWIHVAGVASGGVYKIFINGKQENSQNDPHTVASQTAFRIGNGTGYSAFLSMKCDDVRLYNRGLTEPEIKLLSSEPGIGFKPAKKLSRFSQRFTYKPAKPRNYSVIRNRDPNYSTLRQGLVAAYCPSISGQGNVLPDLVSGNHGTLTNMDASDWVSSGDGRALDFDGSDDYVQRSLSYYGTGSISFWVKANAEPGIGVSFGRTISSTEVFGVALGQNITGTLTNELITVFTIVGTARIEGYTTATRTELFDNNWHNVTVVQRTANTSYEIYLDGARKTTTVGDATLTSFGIGTPSADLIQFGTRRSSATQGVFLNGQLDDVRLYSRALTEPEIKLLASKRGIGLQPRNTHVTFTDLGVQKTYSVVRVKETDYGNLRQGLVGAWCPSLPNGGSGNTLPDVSGYNNHGSLVGMGPEDWVSGQYGRALDFDGSNDYVTSPNSQDFVSGSQVTASIWVKRNAASSYYELINKWLSTSTPTEDGWLLRWDNTNKILFTIARSGSYGQFQATNADTRIDWSHLAVVHEFGVTAKTAIYLNGAAISASWTSGGTQVPDSDATFVPVTIGALRYQGGPFNYLSGQIDDARVYSRVLSESEIKLLASRPGIGLRQESHRNTFYQFPSFQPALARRSSAIIGGGIT